MKRSLIKSVCIMAALSAAALTCTADARPRGYKTNAFENFLINSFAREQVEEFMGSGAYLASEFFTTPYYPTVVLAKESQTDVDKTREKLLNTQILVKGQVSRIVLRGESFAFRLPEIDYTVQVNLKEFDPRAFNIHTGEREGFYCKVTQIETHYAQLNDCITESAWTDLKVVEIENGIRRFLSGKRQKPRQKLETAYAMLGYMALVTARILPKDSVCHILMKEDEFYTPADYRLCNEEISNYWMNAQSVPNFYEAMDTVESVLKKSGVDVKLIEHAASNWD